MSLAMMQRLSYERISRLKQIGLAFFDKIASNQTIAGETQDFYQGLLVGFDRAVKLIDEEDGVRSLSILEAKIATLIDTESNSYQEYSSFNPVISGHHRSICRLPHRYITKLKQIAAEAYLDSNIEEDCICPNETQDFYHGCIAALDCALSLAGEKYAYAQISLLKTNAAYFIDLNKDQNRQVHVSNLKGLPSPQIKDLYQNQGLIGNWVKLNNPNYSLDKVEQDDVGSLFIEEKSLDTQIYEQKDKEDEESNLDELNASRPLSRQLLNLLKSDINLNNKLENESINSKLQAGGHLSSLEEKQRVEIETLLVDILLDNYQNLKQSQGNVIEEWTAFLEDTETIKVVSSPSDRVVLRVTLNGEIQNALSYVDAKKMSAAIKQKAQESDIHSAKLVAVVPNLLKENSSNDVTSSVAIDIEQVELVKSVLPIAQKTFEYVLNHVPERVEEADKYTRVRLGDLYDLIFKESEDASVFSLVASGRGELIKVRGEELILARCILSEDIEFWSIIAQRLNAINEKPNILSESYVEDNKFNNMEV